MTAEETPPAEETPDAEPAERAEHAGKKLGRLKVLPALLALLVVTSAALAGAFIYFQYLPDRATDAATAASAITAASEGTVAVLSYSPDSLDADLSSAKSHLTGDFLSYYTQFTEKTIAPLAKEKSAKATAVVLRAAVSELHPDSAIVLEFVNQSTVSADRPEPTLTSRSVLVTLTKADEKWLISSFNPV